MPQAPQTGRGVFRPPPHPRRPTLSSPPWKGGRGADPPRPPARRCRTPLPTSPLKGGRSADGADRNLRHHRRWTKGRIAAVLSPPPWKGRGREGIDPGSTDRSGSLPTAPAPPAAPPSLPPLEGGPGGITPPPTDRAPPARDPPPDLPPERGEERREGRRREGGGGPPPGSSIGGRRSFIASVRPGRAARKRHKTGTWVYSVTYLSERASGIGGERASSRLRSSPLEGGRSRGGLTGLAVRAGASSFP